MSALDMLLRARTGDHEITVGAPLCCARRCCNMVLKRHLILGLTFLFPSYAQQAEFSYEFVSHTEVGDAQECINNLDDMVFNRCFIQYPTGFLTIMANLIQQVCTVSQTGQC